MKTRLRSIAKWRGNVSLVRRNVRGYTILEVMIFLGVSSALIVVFAQSISGRQARTEFQVGVREMEAKIRDVINDTGSGVADVGGQTRACSVAPSGRLAFSPAPTQQLGTNGDCVFLGRVLQLGVDGDNTGYYTHSIASRRLKASGGLSDDISGSQTTVIPDSSVRHPLPPGLVFGGMQARPTNTDVSSLIFVTKLARDLSGSRDIYTLPVPYNAIASAHSPAQIVQGVLDFGCGPSLGCPSTSDLATAATYFGDAQVCYEGSGQHAIITIGGYARVGTVDAVIAQGGTCPF